jgi:hypothetical protein
MKTITEGQKLQGYALYVMAVQRNNESNKFGLEAAKSIGVDIDNHLGDAIYGCRVSDASIEAFEAVLRREGIEVVA